MEYYSAKKKTEELPIASTWLDLRSSHEVKEVRQRRRHVEWPPLCVEPKDEGCGETLCISQPGGQHQVTLPGELREGDPGSPTLSKWAKRGDAGRGFLRVKVLVAQSCLTVCDPVDCSPPGSSVHGILQARRVEWVAMPSSGASS